MDCTVPSHNVKTFCSAIVSMSKIGKDLYLEFDPLDQGLILRTINDAKSAFSAFTFQPTFFERCVRPPTRKRTQDSDDTYKCRVPLRALQAITKARKGVVSMRVRNESSAEQLYLSFEFRIQNRNGDVSHVQHKIGVVDAEGVQAVTDEEDASELVVVPHRLLQMMEPLKKTNEIALVVNEEAKIVTMSSFHHSSAAPEETNAVLKTKSATLLKSETSIGADDFEEFQYISNRHVDSNENIPNNVNFEATMVFTLREPKAMLQFCHSADEDLRASIYFHWGGKPIIFETKTATLSGKLVMATLDFKLLRGPGINNQNEEN
mmetsp:Transcript_14161/g.20919  ORF Transcript_14161/g.20919 Transcript_14161/m.20919 type:complete len:320 (+) Transcript_14161:121-1080(+)